MLSFCDLYPQLKSSSQRELGHQRLQSCKRSNRLFILVISLQLGTWETRKGERNVPREQTGLIFKRRYFQCPQCKNQYPLFPPFNLPYICLLVYKCIFWGWKDGSLLRNTYCSSKGPEISLRTNVGQLITTYNSSSKGS